MGNPRYFLRNREISKAMEISFKLLQEDAESNGIYIRDLDVETYDSCDGIVMRYRNKKDNSWRCVYVPTIYDSECDVPSGILVRPIIHISDAELLKWR